jgi:DNA-binding PadR family transcriptional regulator
VTTSPRLNATAAALLGLLEDCGRLTGADLVRMAEQRIGGYWNLTRSQVYRELAALEVSGLVTRGPTGPRDARPYEISGDGRSAFRTWLQTSEPSETVRLGLLLFIAFGRHLPKARLAELLRHHEAQHRERLARYRELDAHLAAENADPFIRATLSFGLHYEDAVLRWFAALPDEVRGGA